MTSASNDLNFRAYRASAARLVRHIRSLFPQMRERGWTRRDWNQQAHAAAWNHIALREREQRRMNTMNMNTTEEGVLQKPTPLQIFDWAVVRQSTLGPGVAVCAQAFGITAQEVRDIVSEWNDQRGVLECVRHDRYWRIDAYYNAQG